MTRIERLFARSVWAAEMFFGLTCAVMTLAYLAVSWKPLLSLWYAAQASAVATLPIWAIVFCNTVCFEYRLLWYRGLDARVPLRGGEMVLAVEAAACVSERSRQAGGFYLTTAQLVFVPIGRRWPPIVFPVDGNLLYSIAPREPFRGWFQGGIRRRLRVQQRGHKEHLFIVWKPEWWVKTLRKRVLQTPSHQGQQA